MSLLDKVNMLITPNAFKAGKGYVVIGASDLTVLRNTSATRVNSAGLIVLEPANIMRIDYTSGTPMILDEPQATNIQKQSNDFGAWNKTNVNLNGVFFNDPSGTSIEGYDIATTGFLFNTFSGDSVSTFTNSIYIRANKPATIQIKNARNIAVNVAITTAFTRVVLTAVSDRVTTFFTIDNRITQVADLKVWFYGAQVELGSVATSIIPTTTSNVTRNDDLITIAPPAGTVRITTTFLDNTTQIINTIPSLFTLPTGQIRQVMFQNSL
jgi:hypothetical protein